MKYLAIIVILFCAVSISQAQISKESGGMKPPPGRAMQRQAEPAKSYPDSAKFAAEFKELYPLIKPTPSIHERALQSFGQMSRMFKARGVDSAAAYDSAMKRIDPNMDEKILFEEYRKEFTAEELKSITAFLKSPAGKHYLEVEPKLTGAKNQIGSYVQRTITAAIQPMMKPIERPAGKPGEGAPGRPRNPRPAPPPADTARGH